MIIIIMMIILIILLLLLIIDITVIIYSAYIHVSWFFILIKFTFFSNYYFWNIKSINSR